MKNRDGFVSNSSSSSFIVHKLVIGETNFNKLIDFLTKLEKSEDYEDLYSWGDSGETWFIKFVLSIIFIMFSLIKKILESDKEYKLAQQKFKDTMEMYDKRSIDQ